MTDNVLGAAEIEARMRRAPFNQWMDFRVLALEEGAIEIGLTWRDDMMGNPIARIAHGGVLATLIDVTADFAIAAKLGRPTPTIDLRIDYHRPAAPGDLRARAQVIRLGGTMAVAEAEVFDVEGRLVASGRGTYLTAAPAEAWK